MTVILLAGLKFLARLNSKLKPPNASRAPSAERRATAEHHCDVGAAKVVMPRYMCSRCRTQFTTFAPDTRVLLIGLADKRPLRVPHLEFTAAQPWSIFGKTTLVACIEFMHFDSEFVARLLAVFVEMRNQLFSWATMKSSRHCSEFGARSAYPGRCSSWATGQEGQRSVIVEHGQ
jgi:hypothetical protein